MAVDWTHLLLAYLHDPPDKAYAINARGEIPGHETRRLELAKAIFGDSASQRVINEVAAKVDAMAAKIERVAMPKGVYVNVEGEVQIVHLLSGQSKTIRLPAWSDDIFRCQRDTLASVANGLHETARFLAIWRLWPEQLRQRFPFFQSLPAETRHPDHTIWNHVDTTAAFLAAKSEGGGAALLSFALGPVQRFIEASRSVRDLWSGSMILSWLAFRAMLPIIEQLGPTALIYPALRGNPLLDLWLRDAGRLGEKAPLPDPALRQTPALPHRFLALVPWGQDGACARKLAAECQQAAAVAWREMAQAVRERIHDAMANRCPDWDKRWDKRWDSQIKNYFSTTTAVLPLGDTDEDIDPRLANLLTGKGSFREAFANAEAVREMARAIPADNRPGYDQDHAGRWQYQVELVQRSLAAHRCIRHVPANPPVNDDGKRCPQKCTLLGSFEQMGPDDLRQSKDFWNQVAAQNGLNVDGVRIRQGEALCAVALVKRFAGPAFLREQLQLSTDDLRFPDTWTIAAADWLESAKIDPNEIRKQHGDWNGHWLHWTKRDEDLTDADECPADVFAQIQEARKPDKCGRPPVYYAILKLDGDDLGGWLRGERSPKVREVMHPTLVSYYEGLGGQATAGLDARRPVGPALHAAISTALANFALHAVPKIVSKHHGTTIYSGGDDTLVLLPVSRALACALELRQVFTSDYYTNNGREYLMMGGRATISGGLVVVHAKDDLRLALQDARRTEKLAKDAGKDALAITIRRRSGEHTSVVCPWDFVWRVDDWAQQFRMGASDRWPPSRRQCATPSGAQQFREGASDRWVYHLYQERSSLAALPVEAMQAEIRRQIMRAEEPTPQLLPPASIANDFESFRSRYATADEALTSFLTLCHTASFLARGRDR